MQPAPPPRPEYEDKPDLVESLQQSDLKRWSPRRAGLPPLFDWWPSYLALAALTLIALLAASRMLLETLVPFVHVLLVFSLAAALTFAVAPLVGRLEARMPRTLAVALVFVGLIAALAAFAIVVVRPLTIEGQALWLTASRSMPTRRRASAPSSSATSRCRRVSRTRSGRSSRSTDPISPRAPPVSCSRSWR